MQHHAFTTRYNGLARVLLNKVNVCLPVTPEEAKTQNVELKEYIAIWDTGATHSAITKNVVEDLKLQPTGVRETRHAGGKSSNNTYLVNIALPNKVMVPHVRVTEVQLIPDDNVSDDKQPQLLIGMDIIGLGDFAVTNTNTKTTFSFRITSVQEIDFIPETQENNVMEGGNR